MTTSIQPNRQNYTVSVNEKAFTLNPEPGWLWTALRGHLKKRDWALGGQGQICDFMLGGGGYKNHILHEAKVGE